MTRHTLKNNFFDESYMIEERLPRKFTISFNQDRPHSENKVKVLFNETKQLGDVISDNAYQEDFYRYHDIFHYSFATLLGWSPCTRAMMKCKRKSNRIVDEIEDGARATITEEAISLLIFNEAKRKHFFGGNQKISKAILRIIKEMAEPFEVRVKTVKDWEFTILKGYEIFRLLIKNNGGKIEFNALKREIKFINT